jgi:hypothetical protein
MTDPKKVIKTKWIDTEYKRYDTFLDFAWALQVSERLNGTSLGDAFNHLWSLWREAVALHRSPWLMIELARATTAGFLNGPVSSGQAIASMFRERLHAGHGPNLNSTKRAQAIELLDSIVAELRAPLVPLADNLRSDLWAKLIGESEFQMGVWGSQNFSYCGLVFGYEYFVAQVHHLLTGDSNSRTSDKEFWKAWNDLFDKTERKAKQDYWTENPVAIALETRHAIAHRGSKVNEALVALKPTYQIIDDEITISPCDNKRLFLLLQGKVSKLVDVALALTTRAS